MKYLRERRKALGGYLPQRRARPTPLEVPRAVRVRARCSKAPAKAARSRRRWRSCRCSTRCCATRRSASASCRSCPTSAHLRHGRHVPPARHLLAVGQLYEPQDADQLMYYREERRARSSRKASTRPGAMSLVDRGGDVVQHARPPMIPFYIYYSMFGFQRVGDLDLGGGRHARARLPARRHRRPHDAERRRPAARGRPQPLLASTIPNCISYDPTFATRSR
jgi:pyruvate dehydrogenase E1 component